ncbi:hypothetical protein Dacsa_2995 [Dactylococcopsis salina PCC 8305]|uniref:Uncharacterized protein n=1 Tax=Dactylococcopsis salina (strain PCC 8305) TaxID=13035 RepID=K9YYY4_DACS8|nr:hypothetical protein Dacsa_2995 [Dactylococcopsis salina PCC 8305]
MSQVLSKLNGKIAFIAGSAIVGFSMIGIVIA